MTLPSHLAERLRGMPDAEDFADELVEREAIVSELGGDTWRAAFERVCKRRGINPQDWQLSQLSLAVGPERL